MSFSEERIPADLFPSGWDPINKTDPCPPDGATYSTLNREQESTTEIEAAPMAWNPYDVPEESWRRFMGNAVFIDKIYNLERFRASQEINDSSQS